MKLKNIILPIILMFSVALQAGYYEQGKSAYTYKNYDKAIAAFTKAVEANPKDGNSYYFLGEIYKMLEDFPKAIENYTLATDNRMDKKYVKLAYWSLIILYEQNNDLLNTVRVCKKYWEKTKDQSGREKVNDMINKMLWTNNDKAKQLYASGKTAEAKKNQEEAVQYYKNAITEDSTFLAPKYELGMYYLSTNRENEAAFYFREITDKIPFYTAVNLLLADIYFSNNSFGNAEKLYSNVLDFGFIGNETKYKAHLKRGTCFYKNRDFENAVIDMQECIKLDSKNTKPMYLLSAIFIQDENYQEAVKILQKLSVYAPNDSQVLFQLGSIYYREQNEKFSVYFDRLFDVEQQKKENVNNSSYNKAYKILLKLHFQNKAYQRTIQIASALPELQMDYDTKLILAESLYRTGNYNKSAEILEKLSLSDENKFLLVKAYIRDSEKDKAKLTLDNLISGSEENRKIAEKDSMLQPLVREIDKDRKAQQIRLEQERKEAEEKSRREEALKKETENIDNTDNSSNNSNNSGSEISDSGLLK